MKKLVSIALIVLMAETFVFVSCKKEKSCEGCINSNKPPTAIAGPDQVITLLTDSILLDGSASNDPDGIISGWLWKRISGPPSFTIISPASSKTIVKSFSVGVYQFELKVTDDGGLFAVDTLQVIVDSVATTNHPPIANAGPDTTLILPTNSNTLDGSRSTDPDNNLVSYTWIKISGPSSFTITNSNALQTQLLNLVEGVYQFELKVTDAGGLYSKDTVQVTVNSVPPPPTVITCQPLNRPIINAQLIPIGNLSQARGGIATAYAENRIFFAGGFTSSAVSRVDIYNTLTQNWSIAELSAPRYGIAAIVSGNKVFFAGGYETSGFSSRIDIHDLTTQSWSTIELPHALDGILAAAVGNKILFAGGFSDQLIADIYDASTNTWSTKNLGPMRYGFTANTAGHKVYLAGGCEASNDVYPSSTRIDVYDDAANSWSISGLNTPKAFMTSIVKNGKIYWAGGAATYDWSYEGADSIICVVEIEDPITQISTFTNLSKPEYWDHWWNRKALEIGDKIVFMTDTHSYYYQWSWRLDIYDITTNNWSIGVLNPSLTIIPGACISHNNTIYVAGGWQDNGGNSYSSQVWKLEF